jgi:hypothetical protein
MKKLIFKTAMCFTAVLVVFTAAAGSEETLIKTTPAQTLFEKLSGGDWVYKRKSASGKDLQSVMRYSRTPAEDSFYLRCDHYTDGELRDTLTSEISFHPGLRGFVFTMVGQNHGLQEGEELESSEKHIVFIGKAYHSDGSKVGFFWKIEMIDENTYRDHMMIFENGVWEERRIVEFKRKLD